MSFWQLVVLSVLGALGVVGMAATLGVRWRRLDGRRLGRGERVLASTSAATWMAVMLIFFAVFPWWGRLVIGASLVAHIWLTTSSQMLGTVSAAYVMRKTAETAETAETAGGEQEVQP